MLKKRLMHLLALMMIMASEMTTQAKTIDVPQEVVEISEELGVQYNMCPEVIQSACFKESGFNQYAENEGCIGIMQVNPIWHADRMARLGVTDLCDIRSNMLVGVDYLHELIDQYEDISVALMKYSGDSRANGVLSGNENISDYAEEILMISAELERENGK